MSQRSAHDDTIIGIDIGGTGTRFVAIAANRDVVARETVPTPPTLDTQTVEEFLAGHIRSLAAGLRLQAIGIAASGPIDADGTIQNPDTLPGFTGVPIRRLLGGLFGVPVAIDNDAVCAALAEQEVGAGRGGTSLLHITLGTGIGAAFLMGGSPMRGGDGKHPEAGHISISGETERCYCGRRSCWEQAGSRQALQRTASAMLGLAPTDPDAIDVLARLAAEGDSEAQRAFDDFGTRVAEGLATLLAVYRPETVVFGGSGAKHFPLYLPAVVASLTPLRDWISLPTLMSTKLDDFGGAVGGAILARRALSLESAFGSASE